MNIGVLGYGTVGSSVVKILDEEKSKQLKVIKIFDLPSKQEKIGVRFEKDSLRIITDENIDIIVETLGGLEFSYQLIKAALCNHKHVVTANKEVVAKYMAELTHLAMQNEVSFLYEASVGGGIPLVYPLALNTKCNEITTIYGILNGTTNYILTKMEKEHLSYKAALQEAQDKGFAEQNPKADLSGLDMVRKIAILANLAFQTQVEIEKIESIPLPIASKEVMSYMEENHLVLKYVATSKKKGKHLSLIVEPVVFQENHPLAKVENEENMVILDTKRNGKLIFSGMGAGGFPTGCAIVSDIWKIQQGIKGYLYENIHSYSINEKKMEKEKYIIQFKNEVPKIMMGKEIGLIENYKNIMFKAKVWRDEDEEKRKL